jgi:hypothetical protein
VMQGMASWSRLGREIGQTSCWKVAPWSMSAIGVGGGKRRWGRKDSRDINKDKFFDKRDGAWQKGCFPVTRHGMFGSPACTINPYGSSRRPSTLPLSAYPHIHHLWHAYLIERYLSGKDEL